MIDGPLIQPHNPLNVVCNKQVIKWVTLWYGFDQLVAHIISLTRSLRSLVRDMVLFFLYVSLVDKTLIKV